ncbi:N-acetylmuramoyl-L-alanine amidase [Tepidibacillus marianensis]|uniref:N-acetylmuramoyl-L-alanine amidase n=1 Tax=Tepidibacillus marianensis TaxID=3131995 RepID=UPI0030CB83B3
MNITQRPSTNKYDGRKGWKPDMIVCHITEGSYAGAVSWLCNPDAQASAHFVVAQDGRITQLVQLTDSSWCNGTSTDPSSKVYYGKSSLAAVRERKTNANYYTVTIEHEGIWAKTKGKLTDAQLAATIELIAWIRSEVKRIYGVEIPLDREHIVGHYQINPVTKPNCPGALFQFDTIIETLKGETSTGSSGGSTLYRVQVGAYSIKANADRTLAALKAKGYDTMLVQIGGIYKVQVGAYAQKSNADNMAARLQADGFDTFITTSGGTPVGSGSTPAAIEVGSKVKIKSSATKYSTGQKIPDWVKAKTYTVQQLGTGKALLKEIVSWVNTSDLTLV